MLFDRLTGLLHSCFLFSLRKVRANLGRFGERGGVNECAGRRGRICSGKVGGDKFIAQLLWLQSGAAR